MDIKKSCVRFKVNGEQYQVGGDYGPDFSLNDFIRNVLQLKGTKVMCQEGGCGACIVSVKISHPTSDARAHVFAVNSCLVRIYSCHGWEITTVEGIGNRKDGYHPIQQRLANFNGTQCGFCTPGWVMNMHSLTENESDHTAAEIENSFAGNLCRCTGYRSIADAMKSFATNAGSQLQEEVRDVEDLDSLKGCFTKNSCDWRSKFESQKLTCLNVGKNWNDSEDDWYILNDDIDDFVDIKILDGHRWIKVYNVDDIFKTLKESTTYMLVAGHTGHGAYRIKQYPETLIDISSVEELKGHAVDVNLILGAGMTLTEMMEVFLKMSKEEEDFFYLDTFYKHMDLVAHIPVRNIGTIAGNLVLKHQHNEFPSDVFLLFETIGATLTLLSNLGAVIEVSMADFLKLDVKGKLIFNAKLPPCSKKCCLIQTYKIMPRAQNAHAIVNAGFFIKYNSYMKTIKDARIVYGGISPTFIHAGKTEAFLRGKDIFNSETLQLALKTLSDEINPEAAPPEPSPEYRKMLAIALFYKAIIFFCPEDKISPKIKSGGGVLERPISSGVQYYDTNKSEWPLNQPIPKSEGLIQCSGEAKYANDLETQPNEVFASFVLAKVASGNINGYDTRKAMALGGVKAFYTHKDIPGSNSFTPLELQFQNFDEEILCSGKVLYHGQPVAIIVADSAKKAAKAAELVEVKYSTVKGYRPVLTVKDAINSPDAKDRIFLITTVEPTEKGTSTNKVIRGEFNIAGQYHFHFETQTAIIRPTDDGFEVYSSSQWPDMTNSAIAKCLAVQANEMKVIIRRIGGGFGSKLTRSTQIACCAALVSKLLNTTCRFVMPLESNMRAIGKRMPLYMQFEVGVSNTGEIQYLENTIFENDGCTRNEGLIILQGYALPTIGQKYNTSRWKITGNTVLTDTASNTWMRAPGTLEAIAMTEFIMERIAHGLNIDATSVRLINMKQVDNPLPQLIDTLKNDADYNFRRQNIMKFNSENRWRKRAIKLIPMVFPISYFGIFYVLLSVYHIDGSISISHSGVEMGQGLNTKVIQVVASTLDVPMYKISIKPTDSVTSPNSMASGGSEASECVCFTAIKACKSLLEKLAPIKLANENATWEELITKAFEANIDLRSTGFSVAVNDLTNYDVYGVTILELELDLLTGNHIILRVDILEDTGESINPEIDVGQIEGAFIMGLGYWTSEQLIYDEKTGALLTDRTWTYKPPGLKDIPVDFRVYFRRNSKNPAGVLRSKTTGEPSICMSAVVMFALCEAVRSARAETSTYNGEWIDIKHPCTPEHVMLAIQHNIEDFVL